MNRFTLAPEVRDDLREIHAAIARHNVDAADRVLDMLYEKFEVAGATPGIGNAREDLAPGVRVFPAGKYAILFVPRDPVLILQVVHHARDLPAVFRPVPDESP